MEFPRIIVRDTGSRVNDPDPNSFLRFAHNNLVFGGNICLNGKDLIPESYDPSNYQFLLDCNFFKI